MNKVFGIFLVLFFSFSGQAQEQVSEAILMADVESSLDATVHCLMSIPVAGNALGKEIGLWWRKRQIRKSHITPLFKKVQTLKSEANAQENIMSEVELFEAQLLEQAVFQKCPQKTEEFFKNVRTYIEFITAPSTP